MNKKLLGVLSAVVLLNSACSPKLDSTPTSAMNNAVQHSSAMDTSSAAEALTTATDIAIAPAETPSPSSGELLNIYWKLVLLKDEEVTAVDKEREPHIILNVDNRVSGSDGCNRLMGSYLLDGNTLTFEQTAATRMACTEGAEQSQIFNKALTEVATYSVHGDQLEVRDASGSVIARFDAVAVP